MNLHTVFISHAAADKEYANSVLSLLEDDGIRCWIAPRDINPGSDWGSAIVDAIRSCEILLVFISSEANQSKMITREILEGLAQNKKIIPVRIEDVIPNNELRLLLDTRHWVDVSGYSAKPAQQKIVDSIKSLLPDSKIEQLETKSIHKEPKSKGYVFVSYVRVDSDFVARLCTVFKRKGYAYWDYMDGERDYHGALYRELEERIDRAAAFITVVSDEWRKSDWIAAEFIYAKEADKPIFVIQAKKLQRPMPILLNLQTRVDMSIDFNKGSDVLCEELVKKGL